MEVTLAKIFVIISFLVSTSWSADKIKSGKLLQCADSAKINVGGEDAGKSDESRSTTTKALIVGHEGLGLGNYLIAFPSSYNFAVATGRDIVLADGTLIGEFCKIVVCGFHSYSYWIIKSELMEHTTQDLKAKREKKKQNIRDIINAPSNPKDGSEDQEEGSSKDDGPHTVRALVEVDERHSSNTGSSPQSSSSSSSSSSNSDSKPKPKPKPQHMKVLVEKTEDKKLGFPSIRAADFISHFKGQYPLEEYPAIHVYGYLHKTGWVWEVEDQEHDHPDDYKGKDRYSDRIYECLEEITHCKKVRSELHCLDQHALQQLIIGPFVNDYNSALGKRDGLGSSDHSISREYLQRATINLPPNIAEALMTTKFLDSPRIDVAVHIRNMFHFFEESEDEESGRKEISSWLLSKAPNEGIAVFREIEKMILNVTFAGTANKSNQGACRQTTVFISADNAIIKAAFADYLEARTSCQPEAHKESGGRRLRSWREKIGDKVKAVERTVRNIFIPAFSGTPKMSRVPNPKRKDEGSSGLEGNKRDTKKKDPFIDRSNNSSWTGRRDSKLTDVEKAVKGAKHPGFMRTMVGAPTKSPTPKMVEFKIRPNPEGVDFTVIRTTPEVFHSRQIKKLTSQGSRYERNHIAHYFNLFVMTHLHSSHISAALLITAILHYVINLSQIPPGYIYSLDMALDWYLLGLSNNVLSYRKDGSMSTFAWSANMLNGPERSKGYNLKFSKNTMKPYWNPYTDVDGQEF